MCVFFFFKQKPAYEMRISDWSSDVCSSDLRAGGPVSRLDSALRRLQAQRDCLGLAVRLVRDLPGPVFELGLGNGRTYDHLREACPDREIYVFDRQVAAHADCIPDAEHLFEGPVEDTLDRVHDRFAGSVALAHADLGSGDRKSTRM